MTGITFRIYFYGESTIRALNRNIIMKMHDKKSKMLYLNSEINSLYGAKNLN